MKRLIITADDFGAAPEVNEAVERAHRDGALTAASLMVSAPAAADAVRRAKEMPSLRVGLHIVLVDGRPALPAAQIPDLVDKDGFFRTGMAMAGASMFFRPKVRRQLAEEIEAQFKAFAATGLALDHVNTHKHFQLHPTIASTMIRIGKRYGMTAARTLAFRASFRRRGLLVPDRVFGLKWSGQMTAERVQAIVDALPDGLNEIYMHPATGPYPGSAEGYRYADELAALQAVVIPPEIRCGGFADFA
ncbi:MAG: hopanoid biosynthesis-associated protein HpnK [Alphaproteobacteria bacterium]|nr:hopanoid biosynthesis-associated protein HpnK [Alphaproteobacteria bacterium]